MTNSEIIEKVVDYYFYPYAPAEIFDSQIKTSLSLEMDDELFSNNNLERIIETLNYFGFDKENIAPQVAEILTTQIIDYNISNRVNRHLNSKSKIVKFSGKQGYNINSSNNYVAKITHGHNIVILRKGKNKDYNKFNYNVAAEIDGLYMIKREKKVNSDKNNKIFYAIETKTGTTSMNMEHILNDVIKPLKEMYNTDINYIMVGFGSRMYKDKKNQIFNQNIENIYYYLKKNNIKFFPLIFPFGEGQFSNFINSINKKRLGWDLAKYASYNEEDNLVKMILDDGREVYGKVELL